MKRILAFFLVIATLCTVLCFPADAAGTVVISGDAKFALFGHNTTVANSNKGWASGQYYYVSIDQSAYNAIITPNAVTVEYHGFTYNSDETAMIEDPTWKIYHTFGTVLDNKAAVSFFAAKTVNATEGTAYYLGVYSTPGYDDGDISFSLVTDTYTFYVTISNLGAIVATPTTEYPTMVSGDAQRIRPQSDAAPTPPVTENVYLSGDARLVMFGFNTQDFSSTYWGSSTGQYYYISITQAHYQDLTNTDAVTVKYKDHHDTLDYDIYHSFGTKLDNSGSALKFFTSRVYCINGDVPSGTNAYYLGVYTNAGYSGGNFYLSIPSGNKNYVINITDFNALAPTPVGQYPTMTFTDQYIIPTETVKENVSITESAKLVLFGNNTQYPSTQFPQQSGQYYYLPLTQAMYNELTGTSAVTKVYNAFLSENGAYVVDTSWTIYHNFNTVLVNSDSAAVKFFTAKLENNGSTTYYLGVYSHVGYAGGDYSTAISTDEKNYNITITSLHSISVTPVGEYPVCVYGTDQKIFPAAAAPEPEKEIVEVTGDAMYAQYGHSVTEPSNNSWPAGQYYYVPLTETTYQALLLPDILPVEYCGYKSTDAGTYVGDTDWSIYHSFGTVLDGQAELSFFMAKTVHATNGSAYYLGIYAKDGYSGGDLAFLVSKDTVEYRVTITNIGTVQATPEGYPTWVSGYEQRILLPSEITPEAPTVEVNITGDARLVMFGNNTETLSNFFTNDAGQYYYIPLSAEMYRELTNLNAVTLQYHAFRADNGTYPVDTAWSIYHNFGTALDNNGTDVKFFTARTVSLAADATSYYLGVYSNNGYAGGDFNTTVKYGNKIYHISITNFHTLYATPNGEYPVCVFGTEQKIYPVISNDPDAQNTFALTLTLPAGVRPSETFDVTCTVSGMQNMTGMYAIDYALQYNAQAMTFVSMAHNAPDGWTVDLHDQNGSLTVLATDDTVSAPLTDLQFILTFSAKEDYSGSVTFTASDIHGVDQDYHYTEGTSAPATAEISLYDIAGNALHALHGFDTSYVATYNGWTAQYYYLPLTEAQYNAWLLPNAVSVEYTDIHPDYDYAIFHSFGTVFDQATLSAEAQTLRFFLAKQIPYSADTAIGHSAKTPLYYLGIYTEETYTPTQDNRLTFTLTVGADNYLFGIDSMQTLQPTAPGAYPVKNASGDIITTPDGMVTNYSVSLNGDIGMNFYMSFSQNILSDGAAAMHFTLPNGSTVRLPIAEATRIVSDTARDSYRFSIGVAVKEMTVAVTGTLISQNSTEEITVSYTVEEYASYVIEYSTSFDPTLVTLLKSMLNYGANAQTHFEYNCTALANRTLTEADRILAEVDPTSLQERIYTANLPGLTYYASSCILETKTKLRHYFTLDEGYSIGDYTFICMGRGLQVGHLQNGNRTLYFVEIENISAQDMDVLYTLTVTYLGQTQSIQYSVQAYIASVLKNPDSKESTLALVKAAYAYNQAANTYFA